MGKITEIKTCLTAVRLVGQPIFKQIMNLVDKVDINGLIRKHESDYYYKSFKTRTHLFTMLFGILSRGDSMAKKAFSVVASFVRIHLISMLDVNELLWSTTRKFKNKSIPPGLQLSFNIQGVCKATL